MQIRECTFQTAICTVLLETVKVAYLLLAIFKKQEM